MLEANGCGIGPGGAAQLAEALQSGSTLTSISLRDNSIGDDGVESLGRALLSNSSLEELNLGKNQVYIP